jgi:hypothetical protein
MEENSAERVPVTIPDAVQLLERRLHRLAAEGLLSDTETLGPAIKRAAAEMTHDEGTRAVPLSKQRRDGFLLALAAGLPVTAAAALAGVSRRTLYDYRRRDEEFAEQWDDALEASLGPIEARLERVAIEGDANSMATVRAAEALLRVRHRQYRPSEGRSTSVRRNDKGKRVVILWKNDGLTPE